MLARALGVSLAELMEPDDEGLFRRALELTDRVLRSDAEKSPEAAEAYRSWLTSEGRKRLQELAAAEEPGEYNPGGPSASS